MKSHPKPSNGFGDTLFKQCIRETPTKKTQEIECPLKGLSSKNRLEASTLESHLPGVLEMGNHGSMIWDRLLGCNELVNGSNP